MKEYRIMIEGFSATGDTGKCQCVGTYEGHTFKEAVQQYKDNHPNLDGANAIDVENLTVWGCKLYYI